MSNAADYAYPGVSRQFTITIRWGKPTMFEWLKTELSWQYEWKRIQEARDRIAEGRCSEIVKQLIAEQRRAEWANAGA